MHSQSLVWIPLVFSFAFYLANLVDSDERRGVILKQGLVTPNTTIIKDCDKLAVTGELKGNDRGENWTNGFLLFAVSGRTE